MSESNKEENNKNQQNLQSESEQTAKASENAQDEKAVKEPTLEEKLKISDDKLFYLRARGLPKEDATVLMLESYIAKIF